MARQSTVGSYVYKHLMKGYEDAIVVPPINATISSFKTTFYSSWASNKFTGRLDPPISLRFFNKSLYVLTSRSSKHFDYAFALPFSLTVRARDWILRQCPLHGFLKHHQLDLFTTPLYSYVQDALDSEALVEISWTRALKKPLPPRGLRRLSRDQFLMRQMKALVVTPAPVKAVEEGEEDSFFIGNSKTQSTRKPLLLISNPNSYPTKFNPELMKVRENTINRCVNIAVLENVQNIFVLEIGMKDALVEMQIGKDELVYYADKSEKNKDKNCVHAISIIDFLIEDRLVVVPYSLHPSSSPVKTSDNIEKFTDELAPLDSLPSENNKDVEIKSSSSSTLTSPEASELEDYLEKDSIPPGIHLSSTTLEVLSSNPTFPTLTKEKVCAWETPMFFSLVRFVWKMMTRIAIRKKIMCILATYLHKKPKPLSQEVEEIKENEKEVSSIVPIDTIVMPIRITFDNPIDFNDHFSKLKDLKKDLPISFETLYPPQSILQILL
ncbi:hypothetical protein Tco_0660148 [Tanacetum coccineum]